MKSQKSSLLQIAAIGTALAFLFSVTLAVLSKPGYRVGFNYLSDLGANNVGAYWFNYGMIATAVFIFIFFTSLYKSHAKSQIGKLGIAAGIIAALGLAAVGFFPENIEPQHFIASAVYFVTAMLSVLFISMSMKLEKTASWITLLTGVLVVISGVVFMATELPLLENLAVATFGLWVLSVAWQEQCEVYSNPAK